MSRKLNEATTEPTPAFPIDEAGDDVLSVQSMDNTSELTGAAAQEKTGLEEKEFEGDFFASLSDLEDDPTSPDTVAKKALEPSGTSNAPKQNKRKAGASAAST